MQPPIQGGHSFEENLKKGKSKIEFKLDAKKFIRIVNLYDKPLPPLLPSHPLTQRPSHLQPVSAS